jgi:hypothetical protein
LGEIQQNGGAVGFELQGTGETQNPIGVAPELREGDAQQLQEIGIVRCTTNQGLVGRNRFAQAAGTMVTYGGSEARTVSLIGCAHGKSFAFTEERERIDHRECPANVGSSPNPGEGSNIRIS